MATGVSAAETVTPRFMHSRLLGYNREEIPEHLESPARSDR